MVRNAHCGRNILLQVNELTGAIGGGKGVKGTASGPGVGRGVAPKAGNQSQAARIRALALYNGKLLANLCQRFTLRAIVAGHRELMLWLASRDYSLGCSTMRCACACVQVT